VQSTENESYPNARPISRPLAAKVVTPVELSMLLVPAPAGKAKVICSGTVNCPAEAGAMHEVAGAEPIAAVDEDPPIATKEPKPPPDQVNDHSAARVTVAAAL